MQERISALKDVWNPDKLCSDGASPRKDRHGASPRVAGIAVRMRINGEAFKSFKVFRRMFLISINPKMLAVEAVQAEKQDIWQVACAACRSGFHLFEYGR